MKSNSHASGAHLPELCNKTLRIVSISEVLNRGQSSEDWDCWGVRDAAILCDEQGAYDTTNSTLTMYYTGSCQNGALQQTGRAISNDGGENWVKEPSHPVLSVSKNEWDSAVASTPWVIKRNGRYFLYYRGSASACELDAIGVAVSDDGVNFVKYENNPVLTSKDFVGIRTYPSLMGVLNAVCDYQGRILVFFEAAEQERLNKGQIFGAVSEDGYSFEPMNNGLPVFSDKNIASWPVLGACNPRVTRLSDGWFMLGFNATYDGEYAVGIAFTQNFKDWQEHPDNPLVVPRGWPAMSNFSGRFEGPCFDVSAIKQAAGKINCYLMSIPYGARNHECAVNARVVFETAEPQQQNLNIRALPVNSGSLQIERSSLHVKGNNEPDGFLHAHHIAASAISSFTTSVELGHFVSKQSAVYLVFSNTLNSLPRGLGFMVKIQRRAIFIRYLEDSQKPPKQHYFARIKRRFADLFSQSENFPHGPSDGWQKVHSIDVAQFKLCLELNSCDNQISLAIDDKHINIPLTKPVNNMRIVSFCAFNSDAWFRDTMVNEC